MVHGVVTLEEACAGEMASGRHSGGALQEISHLGVNSELGGSERDWEWGKPVRDWWL